MNNTFNKLVHKFIGKEVITDKEWAMASKRQKEQDKINYFCSQCGTFTKPDEWSKKGGCIDCG